MASNLRVDTILPSTGTSLGIGTASGTTTVTGTLNAASATITGNLGVGGVLTYEDVTNIDSVGVITARSGIDAASNLLLKTGGTEKLKIDSSGRVHIGGVTGPNSAKLFVSGTNSNSYVTLRNTSASDGSGARWNSIRFQGTQSGGEVSDLVHLQANHDGTSDDEKGSFQILVNDGNDGDSLQERLRIESDGDFRLSGDSAASNYGWIRGWESSTGNMIIGADQSASGSNGSNLIFRTRGTERARIQAGGLKMNGGSYIVEVAAGHGAPNNNSKQMDQRRWMWYGASSSTHTVARVAKASSGQPGDGDSQLAAWIVTYTARSMYGFNGAGGYSVMKMRTGRFDYNDNEVRFSTEQDTLGTGSGSQNPTIVFTDEGSGVVRISITNPSSTHSFGEINLMTYDCRITLPTG